MLPAVLDLAVLDLAVLDLDRELWRLAGLIIAILQPVLVVVLCIGFVLASVHLLTMLGTQWGNRRVSSKAMVFSLAVHALLILGMVALTPEHRKRIWASIAPRDREVRVTVSSDRSGMESSVPGHSGGVLAGLTKPAAPVAPSLARQEPLPDPFERTAPDIQRPETPFQLPDIAPANVAPPPVEATPERVAATEAILQEFAAATLQEPAAPAVALEGPAAPVMARSTAVNAPINDTITVDRPGRGSIDRIGETKIETVEPKSLNLPASEEATLAKGADTDIQNRVGPAPTPAINDLRTGNEVPETAKPAARSSAPVLARGSANLPRAIDSAPQVDRPKSTTPSVVPTELPSVATDFPPMVTSERNETPFLARAETATTDGQLPATYQMRSPDLQGQAVRQFGGTDDSEKAVLRSLAFLAKTQSADGHWDVGLWEGGLFTKNPDGAPRSFRASDLDTGVTALATLAFMGKLNTLEQGEYSANVSKSVHWLMSQQKPGGFIGNDPGGSGRGQTVPGNMAGMYGHAMATFALAEAYAMSREHADAKELRFVVERAIAFILAAQLDDGGWRYFQYQTQGGDLSIFGWQLMALKSAQLGGVPIPARVRNRMVEFLKKNARGDHGGLGAYRSTNPTTAAMTAEGLFCRQVLGAGRDTESSREAVEYLLSFRNIPTRPKMDLYYWYYGTLAMFQFGGDEWQKWNGRVRDLLISEQTTEGPNAGSWEPRDPWSGYGGRIYSTALATLCLEVYYRYLPLYKETGGAAPSEIASPKLEPKRP